MSNIDSGTDLYDSQTKGLLESNIGEDTMSGEAEAVDVRDVLLGVPLGVGHRAIQVVVVNKLQDLSEHLGAASCHAVYQLTVALHSFMYSCDVEGCWGVICDHLTISPLDCSIFQYVV